ncbi:type VI secretion system lipoprotein TssJ [Rhodobacteraceae bacterium D3-12]|nr:type VI secretion system lipoprotein TssJ [Rhodobacteraceae bacterium D3-12]
MHFDRRTFIFTGIAGLGLAGCVPSAANLAVSVQGKAGMNRGSDGQDRPVTVTILQMTGSSAFDAADYVSLQNPSSALGAELVKSDQIVISGTTPVSRVIPVQAGASMIGVVGGFISPSGKVVRRKIAAPAKSAGLIIGVSSSGISVSLA